MNTIEYFKDRFDALKEKNDSLGAIRKVAFDSFHKLGIPGSRHEEWKYTRIAGLFNKQYQFPVNGIANTLASSDLDPLRLPAHEKANELFFINGRYSFELSGLRSAGLHVIPLEDAAKNKYKDIVDNHLGHSSNYQKDGINALNMAFMQGGVFIHIEKGRVIEHPVYIYNITDTRTANILAQPRSLVYLEEHSQVQLVETFVTLGMQESFTNQVMEIIVEKDARLEYYKIQNDSSHTNLVSTTHIRQIGKSYTHTATISLNGAIIRNNLNIVLDAEHNEAHLYGLYFQGGHTHVDNHTVVDNIKPHCFSNELYKGILKDSASAVFNGKIFVEPQAQKTNAYQSNKNVLLSAEASVNTKPQLEIFADDVKCSHGCTVGRLDEEGLFYLRSRGISEEMARSLLLHGFAMDILDEIRLAPIRSYVDRLISQRLELNQ